MQQNFESKVHLLKNATYPGRGIIIGQTPGSGQFVQVYWIMGRSENSRNRVFVAEGTSVKTDLVDRSKVEDASLILYHPVKVINRCHIVTNGDQTDTIYESIRDETLFETALNIRSFEPDAPNFTPRISGLVDLDDDRNAYQLCVIKTISNRPDYCTRQYFNYETAVPGIGHCITTYTDDGDPLPPFCGEPFTVALFDDIEATADFYWNVLNEDNRVSLLVKFIDAGTGAWELKIVNKY